MTAAEPLPNQHRWYAATIVVAMCALAMGGSWPARAGSASGAMDVRLQLESSCDFSINRLADGLLDFGKTPGGVPALDERRSQAIGLAAVGIACSASHIGVNAPVLTVSEGLHAIGSQRYLVNGDERIAYDLYVDPARHVPLDPSASAQLVMPAAGVVAVVPIYGRVPHIGNPSAGVYTDVVWLTLSY